MSLLSIVLAFERTDRDMEVQENTASRHALLVNRAGGDMLGKNAKHWQHSTRQTPPFPPFSACSGASCSSSGACSLLHSTFFQPSLLHPHFH